MRLANIVSILTDLWFGIQLAFMPTVLAVFASPTLLARPHALWQLFFANLWIQFGEGVDGNCRSVKEKLIRPNARGVVLDVGAGHGHTALYLPRARVTKYIALEPNVLMHSRLRATAARVGFSEDEGTLLILSCGAEDAPAVLSALGGPHKVDTLITVLTFCSVPRPEQAISRLVEDVLRPGGQLLFYEHVASRRSDVLFWQRFWTPLWQIFFGCVLNRPTDRYIRALGDTWETYPDKDAAGELIGIWGNDGEDEEHLFWHQSGRLVKRVASR